MDTASAPPKNPFWIKLCQWIGLACLGQFLIAAIIGVLRGYSIQSHAPLYVMSGGSVLLSIGYLGRVIVFSEEIPRMTCRQFLRLSWMFYLVLFCFWVNIIPGFMQGRYHKQGDEFFKQKNYPAAIAIYQKEVDTWYLRLRYNSHEDNCLFGIAQSYCQLENFEQARQTYQRLHKMTRGYYKERSQTELAELDTELKNIAELEKQLADAADDNQKAQILFDMAFAYHRIECSKKATELYARIQTLDIQQIRKEQAREFAASCI
ncbi:MAG: hypothetical protein JXB18_10265 [Sedimentisphaerales bacterium]|nr:hypothetical protein [Sedimentisphaerales bacterium]